MTKRDKVLMWIVIMTEYIATLPLDLVWLLALAIKSIMIRFVYFVLRKILSLNEMTTMKKTTHATIMLNVNEILTKIGGLKWES